MAVKRGDVTAGREARSKVGSAKIDDSRALAFSWHEPGQK